MRDGRGGSGTKLGQLMSSLGINDDQLQDLNEEELDNFEGLIDDDKDDISLDSMQLLSKEDENMNIPNFDQDEDEADFIKKEIVLQKFE